MKFVNFRLLSMAACLLCAGIAHAASWQWISGNEVQSKMREGSSLWLIDVRSTDAFNALHIEGSVNIPAEALAHKKFPLQKTLIIADDVLGQRKAREAAEALAKKGHEHVLVLEGGIAGWKSEGLPVVEKEVLIRGVNAGDLKWALAQSVSLKLYDLRDPAERKAGALQNSEPVPGNSLAERLENLKALIRGNHDLASRIKKSQPVVLVFPISADAEGYTQQLLLHAKADIRYLIGGYEAMTSDAARGLQTTGACPTCPKKGK